MKLTLAGYGVLGQLGLPNPFLPAPPVDAHTQESWDAYWKTPDAWDKWIAPPEESP